MTQYRRLLVILMAYRVSGGTIPWIWCQNLRTLWPTLHVRVQLSGFICVHSLHRGQSGAREDRASILSTNPLTPPHVTKREYY